MPTFSLFELAAAAAVVAFAAVAVWAVVEVRKARRRRPLDTARLESDQWLRLALSAVEMGTWHWDAPTNQTTLDPSLTRMLGLGADAITCERRAGLATIHEDDRRAAREVMDQAIEDRRPYVAEFRIVRPDGTIRWLREHGRPFYDATGEVAYTAGVAVDITAQREMQHALQRSEEQYRDLVENAHDIIFTATRDGRCLSMNRIGRWMTGVDAPGGAGLDLRALVVPEAAATVLAQLSRVMAGEAVAPFEVDVLTAERRRVTLEVGLRPVHEGAAIVAAQGIARDVSARRELEAQLRQAQKMDAIGRLAAGVAHDFNNLLTIILAHCESSAPLAPSGPLRQALTGIRTAAARAAALTGQLLAFSRRQVTQPRAIDLNLVVADIQTMMTRLIGEDILVDFSPGGGLWSVSADADQIQQVVLNLAVNARDAMPGGGRLSIVTENVPAGDPRLLAHPAMPPGDYVMVGVSDTGVGMSPETLAHIFEPFFTTKAVGKGTGLGLATVYGIVKQANGFIWVYSEPGAGTRFKIYLPRHLAAPEEVAPAASVPMVTGHETLLLAEDEAELRVILDDYLSGHGYRVVSAADGPSCLKACEGLSPFPRLLISDVVMPGMSGRALADRLRQEHSGLRVLYLSGYTDDAVLRHGVLPGDTHFLQKPFALFELAAKVRLILDSPQADRVRADLSTGGA